MVVQNNNFNLQNVWQINTKKCKLANDLLENDALNQSRRPIILITEPYIEKGIAAFTTVGYTVFLVRTKGLNPRAAIAVPSHISAFQKHSFEEEEKDFLCQFCYIFQSLI
jgi:hypothetical protein